MPENNGKIYVTILAAGPLLAGWFLQSIFKSRSY